MLILCLWFAKTKKKNKKKGITFTASSCKDLDTADDNATARKAFG